MANWSILKAAIANVIKTNGNQEITGSVLQNTLNSIVNAVGENATFAGVATPSTNPGVPDGPVFYLASHVGTYSNFNGFTVEIGEIAIFTYKTLWEKQNLRYNVSEINVSNIYPTGGTDGTDKYTLEAAVAKIPESLRNVGIKCSFLNDAGQLETWTYMGGTWGEAESWGQSGHGGVEDFIVNIKDVPYYQSSGYNADGTLNRKGDDDFVTCVMDVSSFRKVEFSENIYTIFDPVGCYVFFDGGMQRLAGARPNGRISAKIPEGAKYLAFSCDKDKIASLHLTFSGYNGEGVPELDTVTIVEELWDGTTYNVSFFNDTIRNNAQAVAKVKLCGNINRIKYVNSNDSTVHNLLSTSETNRDIRGWVQSDNDEHKEWYLKMERHEDNSVSFFFDDEIKGEAAVYLSVEQTSWNDGVIVKDKGGNTMQYSQGRNNSLASIKVGPFAYELLLAANHKDDFDGEIDAYLKEPVKNTYVEPTGANRVMPYMLNGAELTIGDDGKSVNVGQDWKKCSAVYVPVEPETTYVFLGGGEGNFVAGSLKPTYPVVCMDKDKQVIKAYKQEDVRYLVGSSAFSYQGMFEFTTPKDAAFVSLGVYRTTTSPITPDEIPVIVTTLHELPVAVRGCGDSRTSKGYVTGEDFKAVLKPMTQECVWVLGDSISQTGYGGGLNTIYGNGGGGWIKYFIDIIKPLHLYNGAKGGFTLTDASTTFDENGIVQGAAKSYLAEIEELIGKYESREITVQPSFLLIVGCTNDFGHMRSNSGGWDGRSFVTADDLGSGTMNPDGWDYDTFMERKFMTDADGNLIPVRNVPVFKIAGAVRYIIERVGTLFPNCKFMVCSSLQAPNGWLNQNMCHKEMRWIARRLSIPFVDVNAEANTPMIWDLNRVGAASHPRRFINDGFHPYGAADDEGHSFITAGATYMGKFIANAFEQYFWRDTDKDVLVVDYTDETGYPHEYNNN